MWTPDFFTAFVDDSVLVGMDVVGEGTGRCGPKMREKLVLSVEGDNREGKFLKDRSGRSRRGDGGDGGFDDGGREILNWDIRKWDAVDDFLKLEVDVRILNFVGRGVLKLRA